MQLVCEHEPSIYLIQYLFDHLGIDSDRDLKHPNFLGGLLREH